MNGLVLLGWMGKRIKKAGIGRLHGVSGRVGTKRPGGLYWIGHMSILNQYFNI